VLRNHTEHHSNRFGDGLEDCRVISDHIKDIMDSKTLTAYNLDAASYADDWLAQPAPEDMYSLLQEYFSKGPTADIGCGAGRDTSWLNSHGYAATGYDASTGLLSEARQRYPKLTFASATLPGLKELGNGQYQNVLCETVIMHLEPKDISAAIKRLLDILKAGGVLYLSWRVTNGASQRDKHERLYSAFDAALVLEACEGQEILLNRKEISLSSAKTVQRLILKKRK
jgi:2-polyprenyl-3-methyl-5-hydroxy-6-metoxy-1,4-benzoquinol methylase